MKILAFGIAREIFGGSTIDVALNDNATVGALKQLLEERYGRLKAIRSYMVAVNNEYAADDKAISAQDEIAIIPPVSGG